MKHERLRAFVTAAVLLSASGAYLIRYYGFPDPAAAQPAALGTAPDPLNIAFRLIQSKHPERAIPLLNAILAHDPRNAVALNDRCVANIMLKVFPAAIDDCSHAVAASPGFQLAQNNLAWAKTELANARKSAALQEQTGPRQRDDTFYIDEGLNFLHSGNYDQAIRAWQRALAMNPRSAVACNNIGTALMFEHDPRRALVWFNKALQLDPSLQLARNNIAWADSELAKSKRAQ